MKNAVATCWSTYDHSLVRRGRGQLVWELLHQSNDTAVRMEVFPTMWKCFHTVVVVFSLPHLGLGSPWRFGGSCYSAASKVWC